MVGRAARWALCEAADAADKKVVQARLAVVDPIVRAFARRRAARAIDAARRATSREDPAHVLRLALLFAMGVPEADFDDESGIRAEFERARASLGAPPRRGPWLLVASIVLAAVVAGLGVAFVLVRRPFDPRATALGAAFGSSVPEYLVLVDRWSRGDASMGPEGLARARDGVLTEPVRTALGPGGDKLRALLDALTEVGKPGADPEARQANDAFVAAAGSLNQALRDRSLPYFVDVDVVTQRKRQEPWLFTFYVQRDVDVEADGKPERVVHLVRLDRLNLRQSYLGYTRSRTGAAIILLDQIETELVHFVLPGLSSGAETELVDEPSRDARQAWQLALRTRASAIVRDHFAAWHDADLDEVGKLLGRRRALLASWRRNVSELNMRLHEPERLVPEADYSEQLAVVISKAQLLEWDELHERLLEPRPLAAFVRARDDRVASIQRHELEHRVDYRRGVMAVPEDLAALLGVADVLDAPPSSFAGRVRDEYSAYLAEIAGEESPALEVMLLSRFVFDKGEWGGVYATTAFAVLKAMGRELDVPVTVRYADDRQRLTELFLAITGRSVEQQRDAARKAWERAFGAKLPVLRVVRSVDHTAWRR